MSEAIGISPASENDIPALCDLLGVLFAQEKEFSPDRERQMRGLAAIIAAPESGLIITARYSRRIVGMVVLLFSCSTALGGRVAWLEDLVVMPEFRDKGLGSALIEQAVDSARQSGCLRITLLTDHDNLRGQDFYRRHGFERSTMIPLRRFL